MPTLRDLRLQRFQTQTQLAEQIGVKYQMVQRWETGKAMPQPGNMGKLATALGITGEVLLEALRSSARAEEGSKKDG